MDNTQEDTGSQSHAPALGGIIVNLHGLELLLRVFLHNVDQTRYGSPPPEVNLTTLKPGDIVAESWITNYDSLGDLVKKYNDEVVAKKHQELHVDNTIVDIRDALAHGRVLAEQPTPPHRLYKFDRPNNSMVRVTDIITLASDYMAQETAQVLKEIKKVKKACERFCPNALG